MQTNIASYLVTKEEQQLETRAFFSLLFLVNSAINEVRMMKSIKSVNLLLDFVKLPGSSVQGISFRQMRIQFNGKFVFIIEKFIQFLQFLTNLYKSDFYTHS